MSNPPLPPYSGPAAGPRRASTYASVVQGQNNMPQPPASQPSGRSSIGYTAAPGSSYPPAAHAASTSHIRHQSRGMDTDMHSGGLSSSWGRSGHVSAYANTWAGLASAAGGAGGLSSEEAKLPSFFIPSYLKGTRQARKLEEAHVARVVAQRDSRSAHSSNAASLSTSSSSVNVHKMVPSHRGMTHDIIERALPSASVEDAPAPLPSRWALGHDVTGMDLLNAATEARYSGLTKQHDEAACVRADCTIPRECGIFYYEVTVGTKQKERCVDLLC